MMRVVRRSSRCLVLLVALVTPWSSARAGLRVTDEKLGVTFAVPDGYEAAPASPPADQPAHMIFTRGQPNTDSFEVFQVMALDGTIGREKMDRKIVEDSTRATIQGSGATMTGFDYRTARWNGFELELVVGRLSRQGRKLVTFSTQVPLVRHALQLSLMGPASEEARLDADFQATLASLTGQSSWLTDEQRSERLGRIVGLGVGGLVGGGLVFVLARRRQRRA